MIQRVLIAGYGSIGQRHLRLVRESLPDAEIRLLRRSCDTLPEGANGCFTDLEQALAFQPQIAVIATPAPFHVETARALVRHRCHVLVEKPLSDTSDGVPELLQEAKQHGACLQVGYNLRYQPSLSEFRKHIQAGRVGQVLSIRCEIGQHLETWRPNTDYRNSVSARKALGGGVLLELSHELDYLHWIFGEVAWISAWTGKQSTLDIDVEDSAQLLLGFAGSGAGPGPVASVSLDFVRHDTTRRCVAVGSIGTLAWDGITGEVQCFTAEQGKWEELSCHVPVRDQTYRNQWRDFLDCIEQGKTPFSDGQSALVALKIVEAARCSATSDGKRISLGQETRNNHHG